MKDIKVLYGIDVDCVAGWLGSYGGEDSPCDISRGVCAGRVCIPRLVDLFGKYGMGTQTLVSGLALGIKTQNITITRDDVLSEIAVHKLFGLPMVFFYTIIFCAILFYVLEKTSIGKRILIVGSK